MDNEYEGFFFHWIEEWTQFFEKCNWYTFHPIKIEFENEVNMGGCEMTIIILGFGFRARWNYAETEVVKLIKEQIKESEASERT